MHTLVDVFVIYLTMLPVAGLYSVELLVKIWSENALRFLSRSLLMQIYAHT
jgi:hypothetical protein